MSAYFNHHNYANNPGNYETWRFLGFWIGQCLPIFVKAFLKIKISSSVIYHCKAYDIHFLLPGQV